MGVKGGTFAQGGEVIDYTYYDTLAVATSTVQYHFFQNGLGTGSTPKRLDQTNIPAGGGMPRGQKLTVHNIKIMLASLGTYGGALTPAAMLELYDILATSSVEFLIPGKDNLGVWTMQELLGACTLLVPAVTTLSTENYFPIIQPRYHGCFRLNNPIILEELTPFEIRVTSGTTPTSATNGLLVKIGLNGVLQRLS